MLLAIKQQRGITYREMAGLFPVDERTVKRWISGHREPHPAWMALIQRLFDETFHKQEAA